MIFFFHGPNTYEARQQIAKLTRQYVMKTGSDMGLERLDGSKLSLERLDGALMAVPFLASSRLVIIEALGANKALSTKIPDMLKRIPNTTVAVFYDPNPDKRTVYYKTLSTAGKRVEFLPPTQPALQRWVGEQVAAGGGSIDRPAMNKLLDLAGEDQWRLSGEIAKLLDYSSVISVESVNELVVPSQTETIFVLIEAMTAGNTQEALQTYDRLRSSGENEMLILNMVVWQLRNLLLAKTAGKISPPELAKTAGMSPYVAGKMLARRHNFSEERLKTAFIAAVNTDYGIKSGSGASDIMVEQLIVKLSQELAAR